MPTNSLKRAALACGANANGHWIGLKLLKLPILGRDLAGAGQLPSKLDNFRSGWCVNWLFRLTILLASATSFASARASETCWHPGLSRNIGIAEQSCRSSAADNHNPRDLKGDAAGQRPQRRHLKGCVSIRILRGSSPEAQQCAAPGQFTVRSQRRAAELEQHPESVRRPWIARPRVTASAR
jgi:hypothetical protein